MTRRIECLDCGALRELAGRRSAGECPRCGYLGWALSSGLTERDRRAIRERDLGGPVQRPVLQIVRG